MEWNTERFGAALPWPQYCHHHFPVELAMARAEDRTEAALAQLVADQVVADGAALQPVEQALGDLGH